MCVLSPYESNITPLYLLGDVWLSVSHSSISCEFVLTDIYISIFITHSDMPILKKAPRQPLFAVSSDCIYESWLGPNPCLENN